MAKRLHLSVPHTFELDEAYARMQALGDYYVNKHHGSARWEGHKGFIKIRYMVLSINAEVHVDKTQVVLSGPDPGRLLRGKAQKYLRRKLELYLDRSTPLEQLPTR